MWHVATQKSTRSNVSETIPLLIIIIIIIIIIINIIIIII